MEVGVPGANPANPVFAHEGGGIGVVEEVTGKVGKFREDLSGHLGMPWRGDKRAQSRRVEQARNESP